jgi:hypothetical protein
MIKKRRMRWAGHAVCVGKMKNAYKILVRTPGRKRTLGRPGHKWENIKLYLKELECEDVGWTDMAQDGSSRRLS